ncbi:MAG: tRNA (adenosine(37)-N6)-threonylcarbamoyltransferase complex dimerization subunit type 1 TsaB [Hymenobacteraceae bacterium]|nr:tRNA (adenosine(37)-N6)-threonylcarbamoyltransferase complex dimerization subunit type 1 TsaB [Hymenobacteraceae bacterium]
MADLLLALETSSPVCGVALARLPGGELLAQAELRIEKSHASHLLPLIQNLLQLSGHELADVRAVALAAGPGSYTGLRIGAATAKGLCTALSVPLIAVSTLRILARQVAIALPNAACYSFCSLIDARRQEAFVGLFTAIGEALDLEAPTIVTAEWLAGILRAHGPTIFCGSGAAKCRALAGELADAHFLPDAVPAVATLVELAAHNFRERVFADVAYFEPAYLKEVYTTTPRIVDTTT